MDSIHDRSFQIRRQDTPAHARIQYTPPRATTGQDRIGHGLCPASLPTGETEKHF
jgi:hypothetical protein